MQNPIFVALDLDNIDRVRAVVDSVSDSVGGFKIGPRLCMRYGPGLVTELAKKKPVFVDNKYFDIPNTMETAVAATFEAGATYATVHAQAGAEALGRLAELEAKLNRKRPFKILAVTILTSFSQNQLPVVSRGMPIATQVEALAELAISNGISGLVCSAEEVQNLSNRHPKSFLVVPGIRMANNAKGDQQRTAEPGQALMNGASALVIGRPIVDAADPRAAAQEFFSAVSKVKK